MPWIKFTQRPDGLSKFFIDAYEKGHLIELAYLENTKDNTGKDLAFPAVRPVDKKTADWKPGDRGEMLVICRNQPIYYEFLVVEGPYANRLDSLRGQVV
jgi:hypothetical protein